MQREKLTIKIEHSHLEIAKANRAKWLGQAEKNIAIKLQSIKKRKRDTISIHTHAHIQREVDVNTQKMKIKYINVPTSNRVAKQVNQGLYKLN